MYGFIFWLLNSKNGTCFTFFNIHSNNNYLWCTFLFFETFYLNILNILQNISWQMTLKLDDRLHSRMSYYKNKQMIK